MQTFVVLLLSYLLGSIPFGYLIVAARTGSDIRETGSGGTGATNVSRRAGKLAGVLTLFLDALKGAAAILVARWLINDPWLIGLAGIVVILGHIFPIWLRFRGGKGVATGVGVFAMLAPSALLLAGVVFVFIVWTTRYVSLGSIVAAVAIPLSILVQGLVRSNPNLFPLFATASASAALIIYAHRSNIGRLLSGTENKFK